MLRIPLAGGPSLLRCWGEARIKLLGFELDPFSFPKLLGFETWDWRGDGKWPVTGHRLSGAPQLTVEVEYHYDGVPYYTPNADTGNDVIRRVMQDGTTGTGEERGWNHSGARAIIWRSCEL